MKRLLLTVILAALWSPVSADMILYAEQYYKLYHNHFYQYPDDTFENISYLESAMKADFVNPLNAMAKIEDQAQWKRYRYLFYTHVSLKLIEQYLLLADRYDKYNAYFYNAPWSELNIESLDKAEKVYEYAKVWWVEAKKWSDLVEKEKYFHFHDLQFWEDEQLRIQTGELDYEKIINKHLERLRRVREEFRAMTNQTYTY